MQLRQMGIGMLWLCMALCGSVYGQEFIFHKEQAVAEANEKPKYLYKILSTRNWLASQSRKTLILSADDDAFIHLSTEDQLDKIIAKYWADAPQFVVLKLDTSKLQGKLVFEANPGGTTKYYHLYQGFIPFNAIAESKTIYRQPPDAGNHKLAVVQAGDPVLRQAARELSREEILSPDIQNLIDDMKAAMRAAPGVGLAAPQIGKSIQLIVIEDMDHSQLTAEQLVERDRKKVPFHVVINPRLFIEEAEAAEFFEGCLSVPELIGVVPRAKSVRVACLNERAEPVEIKATGWYARILQHEIDHLKGTLFIDRAHLKTLMTSENYIKLWKTKSIPHVKTSLNYGEF